MMNTGEDNVLSPPECQYAKLKLHGSREPGVIRKSNHIPSWIDVDRVRNGQLLLSSKLYSLDFAALGGLLFGLHDPQNIVPLLATGKSCNIPSLFVRYLSTIHHVRLWYLGDILDQTSPAFKSLMLVRCRHLAAYEKVNSSIDVTAVSCDREQVWMSQNTMVHVQFAFIGLILLYPKECGITGEVEQYQRELCYYWRVIGHILGIDDEYNLCSHSFEVTVRLCEIMRDELVNQINSSGINGKMAGEMAVDIVKSLDTVLLFKVPGDIYLNYWCRVLNVNQDIWPSVEGFRNKLLFHCVKNVTQSIWSLPRWILQKITTERIRYSLENKDVIYNNYCKKYSQRKYSLTSFLQSDTITCPVANLQSTQKNI